MRPLYETAADRVRQDSVIQSFNHRYGSSSVEMAPRCRWDFEIFRGGQLVALAEVKCPNATLGKYPTYMISSTKVNAILDACAHQRLSPLLIVQWTDLCGWVRLDSVSMFFDYGGRRDRNDPQDMEYVYRIATNKFVQFTR